MRSDLIAAASETVCAPLARPRTPAINGWAAALALAALAACSDATGPAGPASVSLSRTEAVLSYLGETVQITAVPLDPSGSPVQGVPGTWRSADPSVATVSGTGLVTAAGDGATVVTFTAGSASGTVRVTVDRIPASLTLAPESWSFSSLGDTLRVVPDVRDAGGGAMDPAGVSWSSADTAVAAVDEGGLVTARGNGTTTLYASAQGASGSVGVTVDQSVASLYLPFDSLAFDALGDTVRVMAVALDPGGSPVQGGVLRWSAAPGEVVAVDSTGLVTSVGNGVAQLTVSGGSAARDVPVRVAQRVTELRGAPDSVVFRDPGDEAVLALEGFDRLGSAVVDAAVSWATGDSGVATVDVAGRVRGVGTGATVVTAAAGTASLGVAVRVEAELVFEPTGSGPLESVVASDVPLTAVVRDVLGNLRGDIEVTWSTAPGSGAIGPDTSSRSDAAGAVAATWTLGTAAGPQYAFAVLETRGSPVTLVFEAEAAPGPAVVAALAADSVLLSGRGEGVRLLPAFADVYGNLTVAPAQGEPGAPVWSSLDPSVASVGPDGVVTAIGAGAAHVTVAMGGAPPDSVLVTVQLRGAITLTFDDGWRSVYDNAWPVIREFPGLRANVAVYVNATAWPGFLSPAQLDELHAAGWSIVSHTMSHDSLTTLSPAELVYELEASRAWLDERGYRGTDILVAPYHDFDDAVRAETRLRYRAARGISANATAPETLVPWMPDLPYHLTGLEADTFYTGPEGRAYLRSLMQRAVDEGAFLDLFFHQIPPETVADFRAFLNDLDAFRDRVLPYHELFPPEPRAVY